MSPSYGALAFGPTILIAVLVALLLSTRRRETRPIEGAREGALAGAMWLVFGPLLFIQVVLLVGALLRGQWTLALTTLAIATPIAVALFPWPVVRGLLIPRGHVRLAWGLSHLSFWIWRRDVPGGAQIAAAWACLRAPGRRGSAATEDARAWVEGRRDGRHSDSERWNLGGAGIVATGLLAAARGDRPTARRLLASAAELAEPTWPPRAAVVAWEWLCGDALERGAWREVEFLARTAPATSRSVDLFGSIAARLTGVSPVPDDAELRRRWLLAPHRVATWPLVRRALAAPREARTRRRTTVARPRPARAGQDPLAHALAMHAQTLARGGSRDAIVSLAAAWDRAFTDPALDTLILRRGLALAAKQVEDAKRTLRQTVEADLVALLKAAGAKLGDETGVLEAASRSLRDELLEGIETAVAVLLERVESRRPLSPIDEWQAFLAVRDQYVDAVAVGGLELRRVAFAEAHGPLCSLAVWLWNDRNERALGNAMFHWLLAEAVIVDDPEAIALQERNTACGL